MSRKKNPHIGSSFDDSLKDDGIYEEVTATAIKRSLAKDQARSLREQARKGGLEFEAYLPPDMADWILDLVEREIFVDPSEAVFVLMGQAREIAPHDDIKHELLQRSLERGLRDADEGRTYCSAEVEAHVQAAIENGAAPAVWHKIPYDKKTDDPDNRPLTDKDLERMVRRPPKAD